MDYKEMQAAVEAGKRQGLIKLAEKIVATPAPEPPPPPVIRQTADERLAGHIAKELERGALARYRQKLEAEIARVESERDAIYAEFGREVMALKEAPLTSVPGENLLPTHH